MAENTSAGSNEASDIGEELTMHDVTERLRRHLCGRLGRQPTEQELQNLQSFCERTYGAPFGLEGWMRFSDDQEAVGLAEPLGRVSGDVRGGAHTVLTDLSA